MLTNKTEIHPGNQCALPRRLLGRCNRRPVPPEDTYLLSLLRPAAACVGPEFGFLQVPRPPYRCRSMQAPSSDQNGCTTSASFYRVRELNMMGLIDSSAVDASTMATALKLELSADHMDVNMMNINQAAAAYWPPGHGQQLALPQESIGYLFTSPAAGAAPMQELDPSPSHLLFPGANSYKAGGTGSSAEIVFPYKYEGTCYSAPYKPCHSGGLDQTDTATSLQLQALRDFMSYGTAAAGGNAHCQQLQSLTSSPDSPGPGQPLFLQQVGEESLLSPHGHSHLLAFQHEEGPGCNQPDSFSRALCQTDMFTGTTAGMHLERSPHRSQFQRENHIMAERQRREEMNEKFTALRAMIPKATKKDKASIVGDTINYVLELENTLKHLQGCKAASRKAHSANAKAAPSNSCSKKKGAAGKRANASLLENEHPYAQRSASQDDLSSSVERCFADAAANLQVTDMCMPKPAPAGISDGVQEGWKNVKGASADDLAQVEVQKLRDQAVIKIMCTKSPGLVFRIMHALDECKVDLLQGNVTTVDNNTIYFITVQIIDGLSSSPEDLALALQNASTYIAC